MSLATGPRRNDRASDSDASAALKRYLADISKLPRVTAEEEKELGRRIREGDSSAVQTLVTANLRFVISYAKRYRGCGLSFLDLIHEGNLGLIEGARRFDPDKNVKFITYAVWWVRQAIVQAISEQAKPVRLPQKAANLLQRIRRTQTTLTAELHRRPTMEEVAQAIGIEPEEVTSLLMTAEEPVYLSDVIDVEHDFTLVQKLSQHLFRPADDVVLTRDLRDLVKRGLTELDDKERRVILLRFGLEGENRRTLKAIGEEMGLSRERIRQIESAALDKLRGQKRWQQLRSYLN
ncbi:MAG: RNA polymerase sigma factor RpoD/SigA [Acidobacteriota bacterium]|nr:RNA polymerase sigma factor RpoD/SigA [Acidobacteriota bacterium]